MEELEEDSVGKKKGNVFCKTLEMIEDRDSEAFGLEKGRSGKGTIADAN